MVGKGIQRFTTELMSEGPGTFVELPFDVVEAFGAKRVPVRCSINGAAFRSTVAVYGGRYYLPINKKLQSEAGVTAGDEVEMVVDRDDAPRKIEMPDDLRSALDEDDEARLAFEALSFTHRREYVEWITEAKRDETRQRRIRKAVQMLGEGKTR
ncbi:MAG: YdeI/OmpD-associated family protein [Actinomycetota bacterium]